ncbi:hypothetical protein HN51_039342 [Arachis hypogaea]|nr:hypothetical protein Ahy_B06g080675 isoform A [Arachis hypogaea]
MATISGLISRSTPRVVAFNASSSESPRNCHVVKFPAGMTGSGRLASVRPVRTAPEKISEKVAESIKNAQETCSEDPASGECVAAWDEVEELSAAASHARDRLKDSDPLEDFCKDNPETIECKTHDN